MAREEEETKRIHFWIFARDDARLDAAFGSNIGKSKAVRTIIRKYLNAIEAKAEANAKPVRVEDLEITP